MPTRPITGPLTRSPAGGVTGVGVGGFSVGSLFSSGQDGGVYEWGDLSTIYQDASGTTAGAVGQADGLTLDKRLGLVRGVELWANASALPAGESTIVSPGVFRIFSSAGAFSDVHVTGVLVVGKTYEITFNVDSVANAGGGIAFEGTPQAVFTTVGPKRCVVVAITTTASMKRAGSAVDMQVSNISVREIPGNHASQATTASKPTLQSGYGAFDRFDDYMTAAAGGGGTTGILLCAGIRAGGAGTARTIWSDAGTNTGYKLTLNASNQLVLSAGNGSAYTSVTGPAITAGTDYVVQAWHNGTSLNVRVGLAAATSAAFATATAGTAGFTIGRDNGAATGYYGDRIYCLAYRKNDASTATERDSLARWAASKSNVTL